MTMNEEAIKTANQQVADFIAKHLDAVAPMKNQKQVAQEAGYPNSNIISMLKTGESKLALDRVLPLARALEAPADELFKLVVNRLHPDPSKNPITQIFNGVIPTEDEAKFLLAIRTKLGHEHRKYFNYTKSDQELEQLAETVASTLK